MKALLTISLPNRNQKTSIGIHLRIMALRFLGVEDAHGHVAKNGKPEAIADSEPTTSAADLFIFTAHKSGMKEDNMASVASRIYDMSKGSAYTKRAEEQDSMLNIRIKKIRKVVKELTPAEIRTAEGIVSDMAQKWEYNERSLDRPVAVVDLDMFYAAVELRDRPELKYKPIAIGSMGMISTANYIAREYGVRSAMPGFMALKLCPQLVLLPCDFPKYRKVVGQMHALFKELDPCFEAPSLDEAFLDLTDTSRVIANAEAAENGDDCVTTPILKEHIFKVAEKMLSKLRARINEETGLTASAGMAPCFMLAKVASNLNKPNGQYCVGPSVKEIEIFLSGRTLRSFSGVGKVTEKLCREVYGASTCDQLWDARGVLWATMGKFQTGIFLLRVCRGIGRSCHSNSNPPGVVTRKGISRERSFTKCNNPVILRGYLHEICSQLSTDMLKENLVGGKCVTLKLKDSSFRSFSRTHNGNTYLIYAKELEAIALQLFSEEIQSCREPLCLRLIGVRVSRFYNAVAEPLPQGQRLLHLTDKESSSKAGGGSCSKLSTTFPSYLSCPINCPICGKDLSSEYGSSVQLKTEHVNRCLLKKPSAGRPSTPNKWVGGGNPSNGGVHHTLESFFSKSPKPKVNIKRKATDILK
eukprot:338746_1